MTNPMIIGVMGGASADTKDLEDAYQLGALIAKQDWLLLNGGRDAGIMSASARGAFDQGGLTIGILPGSNPNEASQYIRIPIVTGIGNARNCINVLSSNVVVACPGGMGTLSEIALALKCSKPVILLNYKKDERFDADHDTGHLYYADSPQTVIDLIYSLHTGRL